MKTMIILSYGNFPNGEASSIRLYGIAKLFANKGYQIKIITMSRILPNIWNKYNGIEYISIRAIDNSLKSRIKNVICYRKKAQEIISSCERLDAILICSIPVPAVIMITRYALKNNCELYTDRTEWYSPSEFKFGRLNPQYIENTFLIRCLITNKWKVICISKYFEEYFKKKGIKTIRIPAIMDTQCFLSKISHNEKKTIIVYAGSPAKKDSLQMMIESIVLLDQETLDKLDFRVIGVTKAQMGKKTKILKGIRFWGRVSREDVLKQLRKADFAVLLRNPEMRFTKAGFPSKVAESLSSGTPMITNYTSDLKDYLVDNVNSIIVDEYTKNSFADAIKRAVQMSDDLKEKMKKNARQTAENVFDYRNYQSAIDDWTGEGQV